MAEEKVPLKDAATFLLDECRMVLPGIQALFGFQLIAVFNQRFSELSSQAQLLHLTSIGFVTLSIALVMAPAAYDRIAERGWASRHFITLTSQLLSWGMAMLMAGLTLEIALITRMVMDSIALGIVVALAVLTLLGSLWFVLPIRHREHHRPPLRTG